MTNDVKKTNLPAGVIVEAINKETKDLYLAAAFDCEGVRFLDIDTDRQDPHDLQVRGRRVR